MAADLVPPEYRERVSRRPGVTVLEVLVVIVACLVAVGIVVMMLAKHRENAQLVQCRNNLREIGKAFHGYHDASAADKGLRRLPPSCIADGYATWAVLLMPYLVKEHPLHDWDKQRSYFEQKAEVREARVIMYLCPSRTRADTLSQAGDVDKTGKRFAGALGDYACVAGDGSDMPDWYGAKANGLVLTADIMERKGDRILAWQSRTRLADCKRGTAYTLLVGEKHVSADHMGDAAFGDGSLYNGQHPLSFARVAGPGFPLADAIDAPVNKNFGSYHRNVCQFLMADGSFRTLTNDTSETVLGQLARRGD